MSEDNTLPIVDMTNRWRINPEWEKASVIWFPCLQPDPLTGVEPLTEINVGPSPKGPSR